MTDEDTREYVEEEWTFLGIKRGQSVAKVHGYRRPDGSERYWKKAIATPEIVGHMYLFRVHTAEDGTLSFKSGIEWLNKQPDDYAAIVLEDRAEQKVMAKDQLARNAKRQDVLKEACEPITEIASKLVSQAQRQALIDFVTRAIYNA